MSQKRPEFVTDVVPSMKYYAAAFREVFFAAEQQRDQQTQQIAREMNCSKPSVVLPPADSVNSATIRVFTLVNELPFTGHLNVGTGYVLADHLSAEPATGIIASQAHPQTGPLQTCVRFEEEAGLVQVLVNMSAAALPAKTRAYWRSKIVLIAMCSSRLHMA